MYQTLWNGKLLEKLGVEKKYDKLMDNVITEVILEMPYYFHLQVAVAATTRVSTFRVATVAIGHLVLSLQMPIVRTSYTSIRPTLVHRIAAIVLTVTQFAASRIPKILKP